MAKKKRINSITGLVSTSAQIIEGAKEIEMEITGSTKKETENPSLPEVVPVKEIKEVIDEIEPEQQPAEETEVETFIGEISDISVFFNEIPEKDIHFKTMLISAKQQALLKSLATTFNVPIQAITYNIIANWYLKFKPLIEKERKRRNKEIF